MDETRPTAARPDPPARARTRRVPATGRAPTRHRSGPHAGAAIVALCFVGVLVAVAVGAWHRAGGADSGDVAGGPRGGLATVVRIVDGDTLVVDIDGREERVRLIGIDTPESVAHDRPVECYGAEASAELARLVAPGTTVRLERDLEARDTYGRLLAYLHRTDDDLFVNEALVAGGFAEAREYPPNTAHAPRLAAAERAARTAGAGLWGACGSADVPIGPPPGAAEGLRRGSSSPPVSG